jgi:hypothetical protein
MMKRDHLSEDRLIQICLEEAPSAPERRHLDGCSDCEGRRAEISGLVTEVSNAAAAEADAAFPADRLTRQHARIMQRLAEDGKPGRVIAFPAADGRRAVTLSARPGMRWIAGAAAAGLAIGLLAGHLAHDLPGAAGTPPAQVVASAPGPADLRPIPTTLSEDELLGLVELAAQGTGSPTLQPLDDLTPRVWEVAVR